MKTEKENAIERWIRESDVDGRRIVFQFTDSDIPILRDAIRQEIEAEKAEAIKQVMEIIDDWYKSHKRRKGYEWRSPIGNGDLEELKSKIGELAK